MCLASTDHASMMSNNTKAAGPESLTRKEPDRGNLLLRDFLPNIRIIWRREEVTVEVAGAVECLVVVSECFLAIQQHFCGIAMFPCHKKH